MQFNARCRRSQQSAGSSQVLLKTVNYKMLQEFMKLYLLEIKLLKREIPIILLTCAAARFSASSFLLVAGKNTILSIVWMSSSCTTHLIKRAANNFCSGNSLKERKRELLVNWRTAILFSFLSYFGVKLKNSWTSSTFINQTWNPPIWITLLKPWPITMLTISRF